MLIGEVLNIHQERGVEYLRLLVTLVHSDIHTVLRKRYGVLMRILDPRL